MGEKTRGVKEGKGEAKGNLWPVESPGSRLEETWESWSVGAGACSPEQTAGCEAKWGLRGYRGFRVDGRCLFFLLQIPMAVLDISSAQHPVKAGLSDAFMIFNSSPEVSGEYPGGLHLTQFHLRLHFPVRAEGSFWLNCV